jgi:RHS repeat-associated protein
LIKEVFDHYDDNFDQTLLFDYDLVSNRTSQKVDKGNDGTIDEVTKYTYDENDRLLTELHDAQNDGVFEKATTYGYDHTQQTSKTVHVDGTKINETTYQYNLQGRMAVVTITTFNEDGTVARNERTSYNYDESGIRISALHEIDSDGDGVVDNMTLTEYLNDPLNITGYSQVLKQTETDLKTGEVTITTYVIGLQRISQIVEKNGIKTEYYFTFDGHGSTRALTDFIGTIVELYSYDAFGNALGFDPATALTEFLYSGEQFDSKINQQYLRQRYYDPSTGRFNRLDPFFGNLNDPFSLHKYLYTHADPVNGIDPSGKMTIGMAIGIGIQVGIRATYYGAIGAATGTFFGGAFGGLDAWAGGNNVWTGMAHGAKYGALFGLAFGAYLGAGPLLLSGSALMMIKIAFIGYAGVLTASGVVTSDNSLQTGIRLTAGALMIWGILSMSTIPVKIELFGGKTGQLKDHINMDVIAEKGIQTDLTQPIPLPNNVSQAVANNPYLSSGDLMSWLPNAAEVLKPGGRLVINGTRNNKFAKVPDEIQLQQCGLKVVEIKETLAPEYQNLTFHFTDGTIIPQMSVRTIILKKE